MSSGSAFLGSGAGVKSVGELSGSGGSRACESIGTDDHMVSMDILYMLKDAAPTLATVQNSVGASHTLSLVYTHAHASLTKRLFQKITGRMKLKLSIRGTNWATFKCNVSSLLKYLTLVIIILGDFLWVSSD